MRAHLLFPALSYSWGSQCCVITLSPRFSFALWCCLRKRQGKNKLHGTCLWACVESWYFHGCVTEAFQTHRAVLLLLCWGLCLLFPFTVFMSNLMVWFCLSPQVCHSPRARQEAGTPGQRWAGTGTETGLGLSLSWDWCCAGLRLMLGCVWWFSFYFILILLYFLVP